MRAMTVLGPINPDDLAVTLPHEHLLADLSRAYWTEPAEADDRRIANEPVQIEILGKIRKNQMLVKDNLILNDIEVAVEELMWFKMSGGRSLVELSNMGLARDAVGLKQVAERTGLNIIAGCGYYIEKSNPLNYHSSDLEKLTSDLINEIEFGIADTGIRPGIIGEVGTGNPYYPSLSRRDVDMLRMAARAHCKTGLSINVHNEMSRDHAKILDILEEEGVDLHRVVLSHVDGMNSTIADIPYQETLLMRGVYLEYDEFGIGTHFDGSPQPPLGTDVSLLWDGQYPRDVDKINAIKSLINLGYVHQILISHDVCLKTALKKYGGYGYDHILTTIVPRAKSVGISDNAIRTILVENPRAVLSY